MRTKEIMKKLADNYETLELITRHRPSSMSRLKNLLMSEGVSETSARRKIADLDTEDGCLVVEGYGSLKLNQELISQMFLKLQSELKIPNYFEAEYEQQMMTLKSKMEKLEKKHAEEVSELKSEIERKDGVNKRLREEFEKKKEACERDSRYAWNCYRETDGKLKVAEEKIARMKKGVFSYFKVCWEDRRNARREARRIKREARARQKKYAELERKWEEDRKRSEKKRRRK